MHQNINFQELGANDPIPYDLLMLADPSKQLIDDYIKESVVYIARLNEEVMGVIVLYPLSSEEAEIKNLAVQPEKQGLGIGSFW